MNVHELIFNINYREIDDFFVKSTYDNVKKLSSKEKRKMKIVVLSFDDGTIYDRKFIELLNKYHLRATFNLNSGLDDYVWYYNKNHEIRRLNLKECKDLYRNQEVASHTLTHPFLTSLNKDELIYQINQDLINLEKIFNKKITSFAVPFDACNDKIIEIIKKNTKIKNIRCPCIKDDYFPIDQYHIHINALYDDPLIFDKLEKFSSNNLENSLFVIAGHSYEFEVKNDWEKIEKLLKYIYTNLKLTNMTMQEAVDYLF